MNSSSQCETLFNDVNDLGSGVAAIGQLLRFSQDEAYPDVLNGIGAVLHHLGKTMQGLNTQFVNGTYQNIRAMEVKEEQAAAQEKAAAERTAQTAREEMRRTLMMAELARLLDKERVNNPPATTTTTDETKTRELTSER